LFIRYTQPKYTVHGDDAGKADFPWKHRYMPVGSVGSINVRADESQLQPAQVI